jgi:calcineurin-like phosphoesterase family protein
MNYFVSADYHLGHRNIIKYTELPFSSVEEMDETIITRHNEVVKPNDTFIHAGDFTLANANKANEYIERLNGKHIFLNGSHDSWLKGRKGINQIMELYVDGQLAVIGHYAMRVWAASHYNSWHLYGHSHGKLPPVGKSWDIGINGHNFYPYSWEEIKDIMKTRPDNPNLVRK